MKYNDNGTIKEIKVKAVNTNIKKERTTSIEDTYCCDYINNIEDNKLNTLNYSKHDDIKPNFDEQPTSSSNKSYTFNEDEYLFLYASRGSESGFTLSLLIDDITRFQFPAYDAYATISILIPVKKGQTLMFRTDSNEPTWHIRELTIFK